MNRKERRSQDKAAAKNPGGRPRLKLDAATLAAQAGAKRVLRREVFQALFAEIRRDFPDGIELNGTLDAFWLRYGAEAMMLATEPAESMFCDLMGVPRRPADPVEERARVVAIEVDDRREGHAGQDARKGHNTANERKLALAMRLLQTLHWGAFRHEWLASGKPPDDFPEPPQQDWRAVAEDTGLNGGSFMAGVERRQLERQRTYETAFAAGEQWTLMDPESPFHASKVEGRFSGPNPPREPLEGCRWVETWVEREDGTVGRKWVELVDNLYGLRGPEARVHDGVSPWPVSPRESWRPHLEKIGRLDLLERFWDGSPDWQPPVRDSYRTTGLPPQWPHEGDPPGEPIPPPTKPEAAPWGIPPEGDPFWDEVARAIDLIKAGVLAEDGEALAAEPPADPAWRAEWERLRAARAGGVFDS